MASLAVSLLGGGVVAELVDQQISLVAKSKPRLWISVFQENSWGNVQFVATLAGLQILIARGPNHSDNAGLHCWIQRWPGVHDQLQINFHQQGGSENTCTGRL